MKSLIRPTTISNLIWWYKNCSNWQARVFEHFHLVKGNIFYKMRNGVNLRMRPYTGDSEILKEIYSQKPYTNGVSLPNKPIIFDVGAHIGIFATLVARNYPGAKIFCFEPSSWNFSYLRWNCNQNVGNFILFQVAICSFLGRRNLYLNRANPGNNTFYPQGKLSSRQCVTLEKVVKENKLERIDLLKLDCEGSEHEILLKIPYVVLKRIKAITAEVHVFSPHNPREISQFLKKHGFKVTVSPTDFSAIYLLKANR